MYVCTWQCPRLYSFILRRRNFTRKKSLLVRKPLVIEKSYKAIRIVLFESARVILHKWMGLCWMPCSYMVVHLKSYVVYILRTDDECPSTWTTITAAIKAKSFQALRKISRSQWEYASILVLVINICDQDLSVWVYYQDRRSDNITGHQLEVIIHTRITNIDELVTSSQWNGKKVVLLRSFLTLLVITCN